MIDRTSPPPLQEPGPSPETSYGFPTYESPRSERSPGIQEPGRSPPKDRSPTESGPLLRLQGRFVPGDRLARAEVDQFAKAVIDGVRIEREATVAQHDPQSRLDLVERGSPEGRRRTRRAGRRAKAASQRSWRGAISLSARVHRGVVAGDESVEVLCCDRMSFVSSTKVSTLNGPAGGHGT